MNFRKSQLHEHELQLSDYNIISIFAQNVQISGRKKSFSFFAYEIFHGQIEKLLNNTRNT